MFDFLALPFMQRALLAGIITAVLVGWVGVYVVSRRMSFIGEGIANASLTGVALALLAGWAPLPVAILVSLLTAAAIFIIERRTVIASDAAVGILCTSGLALGVILLRFFQGYQPELVSFLFGNILSIKISDLVVTEVFGVIVFLLLAFFTRQLTFMTIDPEGGYLHGLSRWGYDLLLYSVTAVTVVLSIKLLGVILVSALLVIPSSISKLFSSSFRSFRRNGILLSVVIVVFGLFLSYWLNLPSGATIVLFGATLFALASAAHLFIRNQ
ncbi:MAG: hypothetical protein A3J66_04140 [Candidatus Magasanikbacteria bacterium RIFCSPHIGHO2_02_FULL_47_14]|uniref:ABC transporter n=1 Tax=Candidatus Magasanikbacteria bacterium RIFCSPHIGHO2_02_FULL_47_14 TaxID=1798680 RepID=A0A1F6M3R2_9BACT|nr:MAG: hypothetical protein A3J66_04140 [Candidatus Magasanikbacteria bacterium RIFCSPHIGHO2_02_FULL_47_14]